MSEEQTTLSKKEISNIIESLFDSNIEDLDIKQLHQIGTKDFYKEVIKQKKKNGWKSKITIPCNWNVEQSEAIMKKVEEVRLLIPGKDFDDFWDIFSASVDISVWGSDTWAPRILPNGAVLIRNHHRVIGIDEQTSGELQIDNITLQKEVSQLETFVKTQMDLENLSFHFHIINRNEEGFNWTLNTPEKLSNYGQTLVFVSNTVLEEAKNSGKFDDEHFIFNETIETTANSSRSGHAVLRVFKTTTFIHGTYRAGDDYDSILENHSYYLGESPDDDIFDEIISPDSTRINFKVSQDLKSQDEPELFDKNIFKKSRTLKLLIEDKLYHNYSHTKTNQIMEFSALFGSQWDIPSSYYINNIPFFEYSEKYDHRVIVLESCWSFLPDLSNAKSFIEDLLTNVTSIVDNSLVKAYLPLPKNAEYNKEKDIFDYGTKEFESRINQIIKSLNALFNDYTKENPHEEDEKETAEKDYLEYEGYEFEFSLIFITNETPNVVEAHKYGLNSSKYFNGSSTNLIIPAYGFFQGYCDGELDTGNSSQFLTESQLESSEDEDDYLENEDE